MVAESSPNVSSCLESEIDSLGGRFRAARFDRSGEGSSRRGLNNPRGGSLSARCRAVRFSGTNRYRANRAVPSAIATISLKGKKQTSRKKVADLVTNRILANRVARRQNRRLSIPPAIRSSFDPTPGYSRLVRVNVNGPVSSSPHSPSAPIRGAVFSTRKTRIATSQSTRVIQSIGI